MTGIKLAFRTLIKSPFVTAVAVLSLALGIGANAAIFSLFDQLLLQALPVPQPDRLVNFVAGGPIGGSTSCNDAGDCDEIFSYPMFKDLERSGAGVSGLAAHRLFGANLSQEGRTLNGTGMLVSGSYFGVLGLTPLLGRLIQPEDDEVVGENFVAVLAHHYWQARLGADPGVLNRTIVVNGRPMTIVGVAPPGFMGTTLGARADLFVPITMRGVMTPGWDGFENRRSYWAYLFGRLKPGLDRERAEAELNTVYSAILADVEAPLQTMSDATLERFVARTVTLEPGTKGQSSIDSEARTPLTLLIVITGFVVLIACANIANLLLARGAGRASEMAIRGSLGASRGQLVGQLMLESVLLALLGGAASLLVAQWTLDLIGSFLPPDAQEFLTLGVSPAVILFAAVVSLGTGVLFGLYPALHSTRADLVTALKANSGQPSGARAAQRFRAFLVTAQIALSMALLVASGLFIRSLVNVGQVDLGLDAQNVITFSISPELNAYEPEAIPILFERAQEELAAIPGVTAVTSARVPALAGSNWGTDVRVEGYESGPDIDSNSRYNQVGPEYFSAMGIPLLAGREFTSADGVDAPQVVVVNETFTEKFGLDGRNAVGKRMSWGGDELDLEIVGVIPDAKYSDVKQVVPPVFFTPARQDPDIGSLNFYVRTGLDPESLMASVTETMARLDPNLPIEGIKTLERQVDETLVLERMISFLSASFAGLATLLAAVGLYGVLAYTVAQRTREIGLRMALGAGAPKVQRMVLRQVGVMAAIGGAIGLVGAYFLGRAAESLLFGLDGFDPAVFASVVVLIALVALGAGYLPARRASRVDPMEALRYE